VNNRNLLRRRRNARLLLIGHAGGADHDRHAQLGRFFSVFRRRAVDREIDDHFDAAVGTQAARHRRPDVFAQSGDRASVFADPPVAGMLHRVDQLQFRVFLAEMNQPLPHPSRRTRNTNIHWHRKLP
jgi:hypothetical protein